MDVKFVLYCLLIGALSLFMQETYKSGMIFRRYYLWLVYLWIKNRAKKRRKYRNLLKPLGLCIYCQSFWANIVLYPLFFNLDKYFILSIGGVYIAIELIFLIKRL